jgi:hypothetical protein
VDIASDSVFFFLDFFYLYLPLQASFIVTLYVVYFSFLDARVLAKSSGLAPHHAITFADLWFYRWSILSNPT